MHLQLIKNAQVQPASDPELVLSICLTLATVFVCVHTFFLMAAAAAGVDAARLTLASILSGNFAQTFFTIFLWQSRTEKQQQQNMRIMSCSRRCITKRFGFGFLAATSGNL